MQNTPNYYMDPNGGPAPPMPMNPGRIIMAGPQLPPPPPLYPPLAFNDGNGFVGRGQGTFTTGSSMASVPVCTNCSSSGHLRRNCPTITCLACGRLGHFKQDCPSDGTSGSPDTGRRVRSREERDTHHDDSATHGGPGDDGVIDREDGEYRWSVCRNCGSSRHIQAQCPSRYQSLECFQCHKRGHLMSSCPLTRCYNCGTYGHSSQVCHSMPHCFHCANVGHRSTECPVKTKGRVCYQCNEPGHEAAQCPQGQLCRMCHQPGHLVAQCPQVTCYQCHEKGHTAGACERDLCGRCGGHHSTAACVNVTDATVASYYRSSSESSTEAPPPRVEPSPARTDAASPPAHSDRSARATPASTNHTTPDDGTDTHDGREEDHASREQTPSTTVFAGANGNGLAAASTDDNASSPLAAGGSVSDRSFGSASGGGLVPVFTSMRPYTPTGVNRGKCRVAVVIDGPYFERCIRRDGGEFGTEAFYRHVSAALRNTLDFIGDIFEKTPIGYWFDTDPAAFTEFVETAVPLAHRERAFRESALRKRFLTGEMNSGRSLHHVLPRLVGTMKKQRGYTHDGPGHVWVQSGVDVALATTLVELFHDRRQFDQVVLLSGDSDVYPAVHYCNTQRTNNSAYKSFNPVRVCGTASSLAKQYGQHQDLYDFLPPILLNQPSHQEGERTIDFPPHSAFR